MKNMKQNFLKIYIFRSDFAEQKFKNKNLEIQNFKS